MLNLELLDDFTKLSQSELITTIERKLANATGNAIKILTMVAPQTKYADTSEYKLHNYVLFTYPGKFEFNEDRCRLTVSYKEHYIECYEMSGIVAAASACTVLSNLIAKGTCTYNKVEFDKYKEVVDASWNKYLFALDCASNISKSRCLNKEGNAKDLIEQLVLACYFDQIVETGTYSLDIENWLERQFTNNSDTLLMLLKYLIKNFANKNSFNDPLMLAAVTEIVEYCRIVATKEKAKDFLKEIEDAEGPRYDLYVKYITENMPHLLMAPENEVLH